VIEENGDSRVRSVLTAAQRVEIVDDLGHRASDLIQANAVIWVEGPSDRIYLNHWLHAYDSHLIEGVHYSIMFYGGRLLSHLSADSREVNEFIDLRRINQHLVVVIDSDRRKKGEKLNRTKLRIRSEFDKGLGFAWVTEGRAIENYVPNLLLTEAAQAIHPESGLPGKHGQYDDVLALRRAGRRITPDKVGIAHAVSERQAVFDQLDLRRRIAQLADFIRVSNGLPRPNRTQLLQSGGN
jgi:hypothetical protein